MNVLCAVPALNSTGANNEIKNLLLERLCSTISDVQEKSKKVKKQFG